MIFSFNQNLLALSTKSKARMSGISCSIEIRNAVAFKDDYNARKIHYVKKQWLVIYKRQRRRRTRGKRAGSSSLARNDGSLVLEGSLGPIIMRLD